MKKIILYNLAIILFLVTGCSEDFLERTPKGYWHQDNYTPEYEIAPEILVEAKLAQAYAKLRDYNFLFPCFGMHNYTTPDVEKGSTPSDGGVIVEFKAMNYTPSNVQIENFYKECYNTIFYANEAVALVDVLEDTVVKKNTYFAEARFLRAVMYFRLAQAFGGVSYVDKVLATDEVVPARSSREEIWNNIEIDLLWAIPYLPVRTELIATGNQGRATQNAARAVLAKTYMYQKKWQNALNLTSDIISSGDNNLSTPYADIWIEANEFGQESVFEVFCEQKPNDRVYLGSQFSQIQGIRGTPNMGWGFNAPSQVLMNAYETGDPRKEASVIHDGEVLFGETVKADAAGYKYFNKKAYVRPDERYLYGRVLADQGVWMNIRLIRYADVLLMHAEAACELNNTAEALDKLEMVRNRARGGNLAVLPKITTTNVDELREKIRHERRIELAMEWERFYDLVRWNEAKDKISAFTAGKHELFPIPQTEIDKSGGVLTQNPGY